MHPTLLGHTLFWYIESELGYIERAQRFRLFKKALLKEFGEEFRNELLKQSALVRELVATAKKVKEFKEKEKRDEWLKTALQKVFFSFLSFENYILLIHVVPCSRSKKLGSLLSL